MNVYLYQSWTEKELKNAYIWKVIEYDFTTQDILTFKYQWDNTFTKWWTSWSWYYTLKTGYNQWVTTWALPNWWYASNVKKVTIQYSIDNAVCGFALRDSTGNTFIRSWTGSGGSGNAFQCITNWTADINQTYTAPSGDAEIVIDLENWTISYWTFTATLTSTFISTFRTLWANWTMYIWIANWNMNVWSNNYYTYMKNITIEY